MRHGVRIGVDVGKVRVGLAASDPYGYLASPVETIARADEIAPVVTRIVAEATEREAIEIVVGLPISLSGADTPSTADARAVADAIARASSVPVRLIDERLSTVAAQSALHKSGRNTRSSRSVVDQVAAVILLQHALDSERAGGALPGRLAEPD
ncbi:Holliday junction resolvase RuvX [Herbiconiux sp. L3-i23]|uniref:Holliday junction resolvase RuvX n=1 Tax=Herbiconiux sp. L3-i23 TaxID=2905871 RepID=UPI00205CCBC0|nr:Holliday junction resolvase RuvX [Herbiconiux sp. L3-i23]BDI22797.1 putative pre-16S rRNA nuclease [Herbiconiux sp. L3-i23]